MAGRQVTLPPNSSDFRHVIPTRRRAARRLSLKLGRSSGLSDGGDFRNFHAAFAAPPEHIDRGESARTSRSSEPSALEIPLALRYS